MKKAWLKPWIASALAAMMLFTAGVVPALALEEDQSPPDASIPLDWVTPMADTATADGQEDEPPLEGQIEPDAGFVTVVDDTSGDDSSASGSGSMSSVDPDIIFVTEFAPLDEPGLVYPVAQAPQTVEELSLPETLVVTLEDEPEPIDLPVDSWESDVPYNGQVGKYIFTPWLPAGYAAADGSVVPPSVTVEVVRGVRQDGRSVLRITQDDPITTEEINQWLAANVAERDLSLVFETNFVLDQPLQIPGEGGISVLIKSGTEDSCILSRAPLLSDGPMIDLPAKTGLALENIRLDGNRNQAEQTGPIIRVAGTLEMGRGAVLYNNWSSGTGGGIYIAKSGSVTMNAGARVMGCTAPQGGAVGNEGSFTMNINAILSGNTAEGSGGAVANINGGRFEMNGGVIGGDGPGDANYAGQNGGGVYNIGSGSRFIMSGAASIKGNTAVSGGGVYNTGNAEFTMNGSARIPAVTANAADNGGGVYNEAGGRMTMNGGSVGGIAAKDCNRAVFNGGGIYNKDGSSSMVVTGLASIVNNDAEEGGGVYSASRAKITLSGNANIYLNTALYGGGLYIADKSTVDMTGGTIGHEEDSGNAAAKAGGGVYNHNATFTMSGTARIAGNHARERTASGGGVYNAGDFLMSGGTEITGNSASHGGGVCNKVTAIFTMSANAVIAANAASGISGGGVYNEGIFQMRGGLIGSTDALAGNSASVGGGGLYNKGTFQFSGGTLAGNSAVTGGGVQNLGQFIMSGGEIVANMATSGGGVLNTGDLAMSGGEISANTAATGAGVYYRGGAFTLKDSPVITGPGVQIAPDLFLTLEGDLQPTAQIDIENIGQEVAGTVIARKVTGAITEEEAGLFQFVPPGPLSIVPGGGASTAYVLAE